MPNNGSTKRFFACEGACAQGVDGVKF